MSKSLSRTLYLLGILLAIAGSILLVRGYMGGTILPNGTMHPVHAGSAVIGAVLDVAAVVLGFVAWVGALVRTAQLRRWGWFICLLIFSGITMLLYIFFGPTTSTFPSLPVTTPPYGGYGD